MPGIENLAPEAYRDEQGVVGIAELLAGCGLDFLHRGERLIPQFRGKLLTGSVVGVAGFRRDREARRHRQLGVRHFRKASAFAPQKIAHLRIAVREAIHPFCRRRRTHRVSVLLPYPKSDRLHRAGATPARNHSIILPAGISCKNSASHPPEVPLTRGRTALLGKIGAPAGVPNGIFCSENSIMRQTGDNAVGVDSRGSGE